jgi:pyridoxal 5'-phosphate synthase pdxT subunit
MSDTSERVVRVGVLALQGAFQEHIDMLNKLAPLATTSAAAQPLKVHAYAVRLPQELVGADALVLPGGESTTIGKVATRWGLLEPLREWVANKHPIWGTCAGMIMLAQSAKHAEEVCAMNGQS